MKIGVLGSGVVGQTLGGHLARNGHDVVLGTRSPAKLGEKRGLGQTSLEEWIAGTDGRGRVATFDESAAHGEVAINATGGEVSLGALRLAGEKNLAGKILIDVANPLDFSQGMPPTLTVCNTDSLGEQIQRAFPATRVVKTLNTVTAALMIDPSQIAGGDHHLFLSGDDAEAKRQVTDWLREWFGWREVIDLGDISTARGTEMMLPLWVRLMSRIGTPLFNFRLVQ